MHIRRWDSGEIIATQRLMDMAGYIGHRGDYHQAFFDRVEELGVPIHMGTEVTGWDEWAPSVTLETGETVHADLVIGADGIKSACRELVLGIQDKPKSSGYACYRAYCDGDLIKADPVANILVAADQMSIWIGPDLHIVCNTTHDGKHFNCIWTHKDDKEIEQKWSRPGDLDEGIKLVENWDPTIVRALKRLPGCLDWQIAYRAPLQTWISKSGKVALIGDAAHPHLPTSAQGASQAVEDAACLAICLELAGKGNVRLATLTYERLRYARVLKTQKTGEDTRIKWHTALAKMEANEYIEPESVHMRNQWIYPHDAEADTRARFHDVAAQIQKELDEGKGPISPMDLLGPDRYDIPQIPDEDRKRVAKIVEGHMADLEKAGVPIYRGHPELRKSGQASAASKVDDKSYISPVSVIT